MEEKDYNALVDMFASDGWKYFIESAEELERAITNGAADSAVTNEQWQYCRGQLHQLRSILGYADFVNHAWKDQQENTLELIENPDVDLI
jgi:hypothetical protein